MAQHIMTEKREKRCKAQLSDFRHRTLFYANRRNIKSGAVIRLDLTKDRYNFLVSARKRVNNCHEVNYVYADIKCRLKVMDWLMKFKNYLNPWKNWMVSYLILANNFVFLLFHRNICVWSFLVSCFLKFISLVFGRITGFWQIYSLGVLNISFTFFASNVSNLLL